MRPLPGRHKRMRYKRMRPLPGRYKRMRYKRMRPLRGETKDFQKTGKHVSLLVLRSIAAEPQLTHCADCPENTHEATQRSIGAV